jgi:hypothetical protein
MDTSELMNVIEQDKYMRNRVTVIPYDHLPKEFVSKRSFGYIINTDKSNLPGQHWQAIFLPDHFQTSEFFDSFALQPKQFVYDFLKRNSPNIIFNKHSLQGYDATTCGYWCLHFLLERFKGHGMSTIVLEAKSMCSPDCYVYKRINKLYPFISYSVKAELLPCINLQTCVSRRCFLSCIQEQP